MHLCHQASTTPILPKNGGPPNFKLNTKKPFSYPPQIETNVASCINNSHILPPGSQFFHDNPSLTSSQARNSGLPSSGGSASRFFPPLKHPSVPPVPNPVIPLVITGFAVPHLKYLIATTPYATNFPFFFAIMDYPLKPKSQLVDGNALRI